MQARWLMIATLWGSCSSGHQPPPDAGADAQAGGDAAPLRDAAPGVDARVCGPDDGVFQTYEHCLGCDSPCDAVRPFCCVGTCCAWECGAIPNDCSPTTPALPDAGPAPDAGCSDAGSPSDCLGCGIGCGPGRPFCCGGTCCLEECGTFANDCSDVP